MDNLCCVFVTLVSPCKKGSLAKTVCSNVCINDDSFCCNNLNLLVGMKFYSKRAVGDTHNPMTDTFDYSIRRVHV